MTQSDYLLISRGQWDETASPQDVQAAIDRFYAWYERGLADGVLKSGSRLEMRGKRATRDGITDGPFAEAKEFLAGFWILDVDSSERAYQIAAQISAAPGKGGEPLNMPIELRQVMSAPPSDL